MAPIFTGNKFGFGASVSSGPSGPAFSASGGNVDGAEPGNGSKYWVFTQPGTFTIDAFDAGDTIDVLVVGGGGSGGNGNPGGNGNGSGGGGGGGIAFGAAVPIGATGGISAVSYTHLTLPTICSV